MRNRKFVVESHLKINILVDGVYIKLMKGKALMQRYVVWNIA